MVKKLFGFVGKEINGLHEAAYLLALFTIFAQLLSLVRDRLLAHHFGASATLDVYYASFRLPDLIFIIVTTFVSAAVLIPIFSQTITDQEKFKKTINSVFTVFISLTLIVCLLTFIFTPFILKIILPGITDPVYHKYLVDMTRILLLSPLFLGISQLLGGIVQAYRRFFIYAISPILYNVGVVVGIIFFYPKFGIYGLVYGVVLGVILHLIIQIPFIYSKKVLPKITFKIDWQAVKSVIVLSFPRAMALASSQITTLVLFSVSSTLAVGSITIFGFANNLQSVPLSIIGVSYSLAAFPTLSRLYASGKKDEFLGQLANAAKHIIFWSLPATVLFIVLRAQIVRTILGSGEFSWNDTRLTAAALALFTLSLLAQSLTLLFVRGYYAAGKTIKPVMYSIFSTVMTILLVFGLIKWYQVDETLKFFFDGILRVANLPGTEILVLPFAFSLGMILNATILWVSFEKEFGSITSYIKRPFFHSLTASLITGYFAYSGLQIFERFFDLNTSLGIFAQGFFSGILGLFFGLITLIIIGNGEVKEVWKTFSSKIWKVKPIVSGQEEL
jgi:putative peptidoglycan lipid II flippase